MAEIGEQPVGDVDHRMRDARQRRPQGHARLGQLKPADQRRAMLGRELRIAAAQYAEPEIGVADRPRNPEVVAGARAAAADLGAGRDLADRGQRQRRRTGCRDRIAAEQLDPVEPLVLAEPARKRRDPFRPERRPAAPSSAGNGAAARPSPPNPTD